MSINNPIVSLESVSVRQQQKDIITNISLSLFKNEIVSIIGPNGGGKSTLIKTVLGIVKPSKGKVITKQGLTIGYVPQKLHIPQHLPLRVCDFLKDMNTSALPIDLTKQLELSSLWYRPIQHLSGGERQRVLLANALKSNPELIVLDEPMQGLDLDSEDSLYHFVIDLPQLFNTTVLIVSHDIHWVMQGTNRVICINKHICCQGSPITVQQHPTFQSLYKTHHVFYDHQHTQSHKNPTASQVNP